MQQPPKGWYVFGTFVDYPLGLEFSSECSEDGLPLFERPVEIDAETVVRNMHILYYAWSTVPGNSEDVEEFLEDIRGVLEGEYDPIKKT